MDERGAGMLTDRERHTAHLRRMRDSCVTGLVGHPAWYPGAGAMSLSERASSDALAPSDGLATTEGPTTGNGLSSGIGVRAPLLDGIGSIHRHWREAQASFVDDPLAALAGAQAVLDELTRDLERELHGEGAALARRWCNADAAATEELRQVMRCYGSLIERLLRM